MVQPRILGKIREKLEIIERRKNKQKKNVRNSKRRERRN